MDVSGHGVRASLLSVAIGHLVTPEYFRTTAFDDEGCSNPAATDPALYEPSGPARMCEIAPRLLKIGVEELPREMITALSNWCIGIPLEDDLTVVALQRE